MSQIGDFVITMPAGYASRDRTALVHVPAGLVGAVPFVEAFHGGSAHSLGFSIQTRLSAVADTGKFIVAYPQGQDTVWNAGVCCPPATTQNVDDVQFARDLVHYLSTLYNIDMARVFATGFSNGGEMCHRLGREASDLFAAIAPVSGNIGLYTPAPKNYMPILYVQGGSDTYNPAAGGHGLLLPNLIHQPFRMIDIADGNPFHFTNSGVSQWIAWNQCGLIPYAAALLEGTIFLHSGGGAPVIAVYFPTGGHQWPGGVDDGLAGQNLITTWNASQKIWAFFSNIRRGGYGGFEQPPAYQGLL